MARAATLLSVIGGGVDRLRGVLIILIERQVALQGVIPIDTLLPAVSAHVGQRRTLSWRSFTVGTGGSIPITLGDSFATKGFVAAVRWAVD
jgi:hypothetical protein